VQSVIAEIDAIIEAAIEAQRELQMPSELDPEPCSGRRTGRPRQAYHRAQSCGCTK
jgi:hypothetical protein